MNGWTSLLWRLARRSERGLLFWFGHTPQGLVGHSASRWLGLAVACFGLGLLIYAFYRVPPATNGVPWVVGSGFLLGSILMVLSTHTLILNRIERRWSLRWRFLFWSKHQEGTFDDFKGLVLRRFEKPANTYPPAFWGVSLEFRDRPDFYDLFASHNEVKARAKLQELAQWLGLRATDEAPQQEGGLRVPTRRIPWIAFGLSVLLVGIGLTWFSWESYFRQMQVSKRYQPIEARVLSVHINPDYGGPREGPTVYHVLVSYEYQVGGEVYEARNVRAAEGGVRSQEQAYQLSNRYPKGMIITAYYNPDRPDESVLDRSGPSLVWPIVVLLFPVVGLSIIWLGLRV